MVLLLKSYNMCYNSYEDSGIKIAKKRILVYKMCRIKLKEGEIILSGKYRSHYKYDLSGKIIKEKVSLKPYFNKGTIDYGFHFNINVRTALINSIDDKYQCICIFYIPAGAKYRKNRSEYISDSYRFGEIIALGSVHKKILETVYKDSKFIRVKKKSYWNTDHIDVLEATLNSYIKSKKLK
jgi:hypothetical protein